MSVEWKSTQVITKEKLNKMQELSNFSYTFNTEHTGDLAGLSGNNPQKNLEQWLDYLIASVEALKENARSNESVLYNNSQLQVLLKNEVKQFNQNDTSGVGVADYNSFNSQIKSLNNSISNITVPSNTQIIQIVLQSIYPVGTVIIRADNQDIHALYASYGVYFVPFGSGKCLLGATGATNFKVYDNKNGDTGTGQVTLTANNIPKLTVAGAKTNTTKTKIKYTSGSNTVNAVTGITSSDVSVGKTTPNAFTAYPPYICVNFWKSVSSTDYNAVYT